MRSYLGDNISERLKHVVGNGRAQQAWGMNIGISAGSTSRLFKGEKELTSSELLAIQQTENVSADWLIEGRGAPFLAARRGSDNETADLLRTLLTDEPSWRLYLARTGERYAIVLTQPATSTLMNGKTIAFTAVEVLAGPCHTKTLQAALIAEKIWAVDVKDATMDRLTNGEIGTYELVGDEKQRGLLGDAYEIDKREVNTLAERADFGPLSIVEEMVLRQVRDAPDLYVAVTGLSEDRRRALLELLRIRHDGE